MRPSLFAPALAALLLGGLLACKRDEVSRSRETPREQPPMPHPTLPPVGGDMQGDVPMPPAPGAPLKWTLPKGWTEQLIRGMRYATLKPPATGTLDVSVVVLPGAAGGELSNVNRWRGQIGLPPIDEAALGRARQVVKSKAGNLAVFDFTSEGQAKSRMVTGILVAPDSSTWFFKMVGDVEPVAQSKPDFTRLMESLRLDSAN